MTIQTGTAAPVLTGDAFVRGEKRRRIDLKCRLKGEVSPIGVSIEKYQLEEKDGQVFLEVIDSSASRPWMQAAMREHLHGRKIALPSWAAAAL